jgi:hypothetical protein
MKQIAIMGTLATMLSVTPANANSLMDATRELVRGTVNTVTSVAKKTVSVTKKVLLVPVKVAETAVGATKDLLSE